MTPTFRARLLFAHGVVVLATFAIGGALLDRAHRRDIERRQASELTRSARALSASLPRRADWDSLADALSTTFYIASADEIAALLPRFPGTVVWARDHANVDRRWIAAPADDVT